MNYYNNIDINLYNKQVSIIITRFKNRLLEDIEFNALFSNKNYEKEVNDLTLNIKNIIKKNIRFISAMIVVIILGIFGISYALKVAPFNKIAVNIDSTSMDVNITYDTGVNSADISNSGNLLP